MHLELEEEKSKNRKLEQQIKIFSDEVMNIKTGVCQASIPMDIASTIETNNNAQGSTVSKNNGLQITKHLKRSVLANT